jgi:cytidyltransferase-like protein
MPNLTIGFTVGVFDLLHRGHENLLSLARSHCDHLIVGVTTDWITRIQKGHERPAQSFELRRLNVQNHPAVDRVIEIDTLDVTPYLQMIDIWIVGGDQKNMRPTSWPGRIIRIPLTPGISTTQLLEEH